MDTKLKSNKIAVYIKRLCFPLVLAAVILSFTTFVGLANGDLSIFLNQYSPGDGEHDYYFSQEMLPYVSTETHNWFNYKDESKIKDGEYVTDLLIIEKKELFINEKEEKIREIKDNFYNRYDFISKSSYDYGGKEGGYKKVTHGDFTVYCSPIYSDEKLKNIFDEWSLRLDEVNKKYDLSEANIKKNIIKDQQTVIKNRKKALDKINEGGLAYITYSGSNYLTNTEHTKETFDESFYKVHDYKFGGDVHLKIGLSETQFKAIASIYEAQEAKSARNVVLFGICLLTALLATVWICVFAGKRVNESGIHLCALDKIPLGIIYGVSVFVWCMSFIFLQNNAYFIFYHQDILFCIFGMIFSYVSWLFVILSLSTTVKHLRRREFLRSTLLYKLYVLFIRPVQSLILLCFKGKKSAKIIILVIAGYSAAAGIVMFFTGLNSIYRPELALFFFLMLLIITALFYVWLARYTDSLSKLITGVSKLRSGGVKERIPLLGDKYLNNMAEDVNSIADGLSAAVENELKSERMKIELITNVSHDIKTPLTSVINYVGLLKEAELPEPSAEYVRILGEKSDRLKNLVEDLFLVSKANSGEIEFKVEEICVDDILEQAAAEYTDQFAENNLALRINSGERKMVAWGDGARMWRVLSNLFANAAKYSLPGTRVYFDITRENGTVCITAKNIANYEMNFDADEIKERLKRADEARTTEGSGLGLAIAESFMELQGGRLQIEVDGDMFKVKAILRAAL